MTIPVYKPVENYYILYIKQNKNIKQKEKQTMSETFFTIAEQKQKIINFIKKHKDILGLTEKVKDITDEYLDELENADNAKFLRLASDIRLKFGQNFYIFSAMCSEDIRHNMRSTIGIWLPDVFIKITTDKAIEEFCGSLSFADVIEKGYCAWYNMTPKCWEMFEAIFDFYDNTSLQTG